MTRGYRGLPGVTKGYKGLQGVTRGYRGLERIIETFFSLERSQILFLGLCGRKIKVEEISNQRCLCCSENNLNIDLEKVASWFN